MHIYGDVLDWYANWVKDYAILAWGFTFRDADHMQKFLESPTYRRWPRSCARSRALRILAAAATQPRILFSKKPISSLSDLNGVKMRVPEIKTYLKLWETLGTRPSRLAWGEIYLGLKTGVVEAAEGPISSAYRRQVPRGGAERHPHRSPDVLGPHHHQREGLHGDCRPTCRSWSPTARSRRCRTRARRRRRKPRTWCARWPPKARQGRRSIDKGRSRPRAAGKAGQDGEGRRVRSRRSVGTDPEALAPHAVALRNEP